MITIKYAYPGQISLNEADVASIDLAIINARKNALTGICKRKICMEILRTATDYHGWLTTHQAGSTYSTFCNDFNFTPYFVSEDLIDREHIFEMVTNLIEHANLIANDIDLVFEPED